MPAPLTTMLAKKNTSFSWHLLAVVCYYGFLTIPFLHLLCSHVICSSYYREVLRVCAECHELSVPVRRAEKRILNGLNKQVRYAPPKKEIVRTPADKVYQEGTCYIV